MIQKGSYLRVIDNSGASLVSCIHLYNGYRRRYAKVGDTILVSIKSMRKTKRENVKIKKGDVVKAIVVRTKTPFFFNSLGNSSKFLDNGVILMNNQNKYLGNRIFGPVPNMFRYTRFLKLTMMGSGVVFFS
jgi:large subunit ribosomal protein L14